MTRHSRPVMHGRDHASDGPDPVPLSAIQFDTQPQDGDWLYVRTTDENPAGPVDGIALVADGGSASFVSEESMIIESTTEDVNLYADVGSINVTGQNGVNINANGDGGVIIQVTGTGDIVIQIVAGTNLKLVGLPTVPGGTGAVYNDLGTLKIS